MQGLTLVAMFLAGLLGSAHCLTMCGGLAAALATAPGGGRWRVLLYQMGRLLSYGIIGGLVGTLGMSFGAHVATERWSLILRVATAALIVLLGLRLALSDDLTPLWLRTPERLGSLLWRRLFPLAQHALPKRPVPRAVVLGMLWGWMPCGLIYTTLMVAATAGSAWGGLLIMLAFGLGTVPAILGVGQFAACLPRAGSGKARLAGAVLVACGLWTAALPIAALYGGSQGPAHHCAVPT